MKIPLDYVCVKTGVLCPRCQRLVNTGVVKDYEVTVMKALLDLEEKIDFRFLKDATYVTSLKTNGMMVLIIEANNPEIHPRLLGRLGRELGERLGLRVKVINKANSSVRELAKQLIYPARVTGVNTLWLPDGTIEHIVRVPRSDARFLPANMHQIEEILSKITGMNVRIRTEH